MKCNKRGSINAIYIKEKNIDIFNAVYLEINLSFQKVLFKKNDNMI